MEEFCVNADQGISNNIFRISNSILAIIHSHLHGTYFFLKIHSGELFQIQFLDVNDLQQLLLDHAAFSTFNLDSTLLLTLFPDKLCCLMLSTQFATLDFEDNESELIDAQESSDEFEDEVLLEGDDRSDYGDEQEETFEEDDDDMSMMRIGLHDLNTLRHLYRFGLLKASDGTSCSFSVLIKVSKGQYPPSDDLNNKISIW